MNNVLAASVGIFTREVFKVIVQREHWIIFAKLKINRINFTHLLLFVKRIRQCELYAREKCTKYMITSCR